MFSRAIAVVLICLTGSGAATKLPCLKTEIPPGKLTSHNLGDVPCDRRLEEKSCSVPCKTGFMADDGRSQAITITCELIQGRRQWTGWKICTAMAKSTRITSTPKTQSTPTKSHPAVATTTTPINCPFEPQIDFPPGHIQIPNCSKTNPTDTCVVTCESGYKFADSNTRTITCQNDGRWSSPPPCSEIDCPSYTSLDLNSRHLVIAPNPRCAGKHVGDTCAVQCERGYGGLSPEKKTIRCEVADDNISGKWVGYEDLTCASLQCKPPDLRGMNKPKTSGNCPGDQGSKCALSCKRGHKFSDGTAQKDLTCSLPAAPNRQPAWSGDIGICIKMRCQPLRYQDSKINTGDCSEKDFGSRCTIQCTEGYAFSVEPRVKHFECDLNSEGTPAWVANYRSIGTCQELLCPALHFSSDANQPEIIGACDNRPKSACTVRCRDGYDFSSRGRRKKVTCSLGSDDESPQWSENRLDCKKMACSTTKFKDVNLVKTNCFSSLFGSSCVIHCKQGYKFADGFRRKTIHCSSTGGRAAWSPPPDDIAICQKIKCSRIILAFGTPPAKSFLPTTTNACSRGLIESGSGCFLTCPVGYAFGGEEEARRVTCDDATEAWTPTVNELGFCTLKISEDGNCEYWASGEKASSKANAQLKCKEILGIKSVLAMPKTTKQKSFANKPVQYYIGASVKEDGSAWDDGEAIRYISHINGKCVYIENYDFYTVSCETPSRYMCERPKDTYNPCEPNPCKSGGLCTPLGCSYTCKCQENFFGRRCQDDPFDISIWASAKSVGRGNDVTISYDVKSNAGQASFRLYINGEKHQELDGITKTWARRRYVAREITNDIYISAKIFLEKQQDSPVYECKKVSVRNSDEPVNITNDICDGTTLQIEWKGLGTENTLAIPYDVYLDEKKNGTSKSVIHIIKGLAPVTDYNIKIIPHLEGCQDHDLFKSYQKRTSRGPPDASIITLPPAVKTANSKCTFSWTNDRLDSVGGFKIKVTENVRSLPGSADIPSTQTPYENDFNNDILQYSHPTKPNSIYEVMVGTKPLSLCQEASIRWTKAIGCQTDFAPPDKASIPTPVKPSTKGKSVSVKISSVDERNGQVSCYLVVVLKVNETASGNSTTEPTTDINKLAKANETIGDNIAFISLALTRFEGSATHDLGDGRMTCCDMSNSSVSCDQEKTRRRKRATGENVIRGENRELDPDASYRHYVIVSTPTENGEPALIAGPLSEPWSSPAPGSDEAAESIALLVVLPIVLILLAMLVVGVIMYKRKCAKNKIQPAFPGQQLVPLHERQNQEEPIEIDVVGENPDAIVERALRSHSFQLANLFQIMEDKRANENMLFQEEFKKDLMGAVNQCSLTSDIAKLPANENKNRYRNIVPYDSSRVVLKKIPGDEFSEYINAAYIDGYKFPKKFIATQGPQSQTIPDFWRMIWEQESCIIAVLTRMVEKRKVKCAQYWPEDEDVPSGYDNISVTLVETMTYGDFLKRKLAVSKDGETRTIFQLHFIAWPDHGIPDTTSSIFRFHKAVMNSQPSSAGPIVVHCSAGVGRTGTFIALDILSEQMFGTEELNICVVVAKMRTRRTEMVQTLDQYIYIHKLVLELYQFGETDVDVSGFNAAYNNLKRVTGQRSEIEQEFERLDYFLPLVREQTNGRKQANKQFNRDPSVLPYDHKGVIIQMNPTDKNVPYYNASVIAAYQTTNIFVVAQTPEEKTVEMFWRTVLDNNVSMIVALCQKTETSNYCYWPKRSESSKYGSVLVRTFQEATDMGCVERKFEVASKEKKVTISQIFYEQWSERIAPASCGIVLDVIAKVEKHHQTLTNTGNKTTLVHCSDGSGRSGTFCAISNLIERLKNENRVDVFRTVKDLRDQRPMMVRSLGQYEFCYQAVSEFLQSFDLYGNFQ